METIIINNDNLSDNEVDSKEYKARAFLVTTNSFLVCYYAGVFLLPGGSVDLGETSEATIKRELEEETGVLYNSLEHLFTVRHYQKDYPKRNGSTINRLLITDYYYGPFCGINYDNVQRTEKEIKGNFDLRMVRFDEVDLLLETETGNVRKPFYDRELSESVNILKLKRK